MRSSALPIKFIIKLVLLISFSGLFIYFLYHNKMINFNMLSFAFKEHKKLILLIAVMQWFNFLFMTLRYYNLLKIFGIKAKFFNVVEASFVSNGLGQWLPGALAVIEVLRVSLMLGMPLQHSTSDSKKNLADLKLTSKLTAVSIFDRLIGIFVMLLFSAGTSLYIYFFTESAHDAKINNGLLGLLLFSVGMSVALIMLPIFSKSILFRNIFARVERKTLLLFRRGFMHKVLLRIFHEFSSLFDAVALGGKKLSHLWPSFIYSILCFFVFATGWYMAGIAVAGEVPYMAIIASISILSLASLVPIGFGGIGWLQIVAVYLMSVFNVTPQHASSAQLLQNAVNLLAGSVASALFIYFSIKRIWLIVRSKN